MRLLCISESYNRESVYFAVKGCFEYNRGYDVSNTHSNPQSGQNGKFALENYG